MFTKEYIQKVNEHCSSGPTDTISHWFLWCGICKLQRGVDVLVAPQPMYKLQLGSVLAQQPSYHHS